MGVVVRLAALLTVVMGGPLVALAITEAVVRHHAPVAPAVDSNAAKAEPLPAAVALAPGPLPQFIGRPRSRDGDQVLFDVDKVELGQWDATDPVLFRGAALVPWRQYRVVLLPGAPGSPRRVADVDTVGVTMPSGAGAFSVLPLYDLLAILAAPLVLLALTLLVVSSRRQARTEEGGVEVGGLRSRRSVRSVLVASE